MEWSVIGVVVAVIVGSTCRLLIQNGTIMSVLAVAAVIAGAIWAEVHFPIPLSHDTTESSTWSSYIISALYGTWAYGTAGVMAVITGWHLANRLYSNRR